VPFGRKLNFLTSGEGIILEKRGLGGGIFKGKAGYPKREGRLKKRPKHQKRSSPQERTRNNNHA